MAYNKPVANAKAFRPKQRGKDRRVTLDMEGRREHTRLFHRPPSGKATRPHGVWKQKGLWNKQHEREVRRENEAS
jgi:hypothetical protein